ncbi:Rieske 2Fe-2S domain-containing protein [Demequina capsici]|uniref:Cytochrome bc1 complex Rieske iron-sulfur subunit n=1 Tax=Demequina capsici TaxID=3075620 RepID=A0AA96JBY4_9MICO|nr:MULTISPECIES: Rieske 2Fe-2S domain-containing protein [unclassified Demequina]WNM25678.1 Rieske 2Fe-2S domain-containing protein [Demequina sp. OYTSA14]WNM28573.1 Rieske 2Fe-2S domain-containing protein [Demequina sp. PMTSA13]
MSIDKHTEPSSDSTFEDPGLPYHRPRKADVDPKAADRAERQTAFLFGLSILGTILALVGYFGMDLGDTVGTVRSFTAVLGLGIAVAMLGIGTGAIHWAKTLMRDHEMVEERHPMRSSDEARDGAVQDLKDGVVDSGLAGPKRRSLLKGSLITALAIAPLSLLVPQIGSMGADWNVSKFRSTMWAKGVRLTKDPSGDPIKASDVTIGSVFHVIPDGLNDLEEGKLEEKAKAVVLLVRLNPADLNVQPGRENWSFDGIIAYSKICTHVGCPVALYEQQTHHLLCPCHQSTFDVANGAKVVFGPAKRPLPQLPIAVDDEGYIIAQSDFHEPVGPSFWDRLKGDDTAEEVQG